MPAVKIAPSVLASDLGNLNYECQRMMDCGADWLHMGACTTTNADIMDGHFVPNIVMGAPVIQSVAKAVPHIFMDCHMMVSEPLKVCSYVLTAVDQGHRCGGWQILHLPPGSDRYVPRTYADDPLEVVRQIKAAGMRASVAINPGTPATEISDELAHAVDMILVMTVWPGAGGQKFIAECMPKVAELRARFADLDVEVDGGVGPKTIAACADAGANVIVAGTAVFNDPQPSSVIEYLRTQCEQAQARIREERERILRGDHIDGAGIAHQRTYLSGDAASWCHPRAYLAPPS